MMKWAILLCCAVLVAATAVHTRADDNGEASVRELLIAEDTRWRASLSMGLEISEHMQWGPTYVSRVTYRDETQLMSTRWTDETDRGIPDAREMTVRAIALVVGTDSGWLRISRSDGSSDDFRGYTSSTCEDGELFYMLAMGVDHLVEKLTVEGWLRKHGSCVLTSGDPSTDHLELFVGEAPEVEERFRKGERPPVVSKVGLLCEFSKASGWRPTRLRELYLLRDKDAKAARDFGAVPFQYRGVDYYVKSEVRWSRFVDAGGTMLPTQMELVRPFNLSQEGVTAPEPTTTVDGAIRRIDGAWPKTVSFGLAPPAWFGTHGVVAKKGTAEMSRFERRPENTVEKSLDAAIERGATAVAPESPEGHWSRRLAWWAGVALGGLLIGALSAFAWRRMRRKGTDAGT